MTDKQKIDRFLKLQNKGIQIEDIAIELNYEVKQLRRFLNKNGYKSVKGKYEKKEDTIVGDIKQLELTINPSKKTTNKSTTKSHLANSNKISKAKPAKVNVSAQDLDKLCEVYDWYLSIKDIKTLQPKGKKAKKDVIIDACNMSELKASRVQIEKSTWEEFERLCSNSKHTKQEILTQAIKEFLQQYKHLI
ncbi:MAG: DNA-binding protein [Romboutsia sp.]